MKIKALRNIRIGKGEDSRVIGPRAEAGDKGDVPDDVGKALVEQGLAERSAGKPSGGSEGGGNTSAQALIAEAGESEDMDRLKELAGDSRKTVADAAQHRIATLEQASGSESGEGAGDSGESTGTGAE